MFRRAQFDPDATYRLVRPAEYQVFGHSLKRGDEIPSDVPARTVRVLWESRQIEAVGAPKASEEELEEVEDDELKSEDLNESEEEAEGEESEEELEEEEEDDEPPAPKADKPAATKKRAAAKKTPAKRRG